MPSSIIRRHYPIANLNFRDFWDICSRFQTIHSEFRHVFFTVDGMDSFLVLDEPKVSVVTKKIEGKEERIRKFAARFYTSRTRQDDGYGISELQYRPVTHDRFLMGLTFYSDTIDKASYFRFDEELRSNYEFVDASGLNVEFGKPCEVLAAVIDIRGFTQFCEQPNIESPYTCGLMSAFYSIVNRAFESFPPEMIKFLGDGVVAIWETSPTDREIVVQIALDGALSLTKSWQLVRESPYFSHGAPEGIGVGISFGLASHLKVGDDYIGRPINIASRLCGACPGGKVFVDQAVPKLPPHLKPDDIGVPLKPFGRLNTWSYRAGMVDEKVEP